MWLRMLLCACSERALRLTSPPRDASSLSLFKLSFIFVSRVPIFFSLQFTSALSAVDTKRTSQAISKIEKLKGSSACCFVVVAV